MKLIQHEVNMTARGLAQLNGPPAQQVYVLNAFGGATYSETSCSWQQTMASHATQPGGSLGFLHSKCAECTPFRVDVELTVPGAAPTR